MAPDPDELNLGPDVDLVGDAGPVFEPAAAATPAIDVAGALEGGSKWHASRVSSILQAQGAAVHAVLAVDKGRSQEWLYTEADLNAIAPALARILNRYPATRVAAEGGDELAVSLGFGGYFLRSWSERRAALLAARLESEHVAGDAYAPGPAAPTPADQWAGEAQTVEELEAELEEQPPLRARGPRA